MFVEQIFRIFDKDRNGSIDFKVMLDRIIKYHMSRSSHPGKSGPYEIIQVHCSCRWETLNYLADLFS